MSVVDFNFGSCLGEFVNDLPDDLMQGYDGQGSTSELQTAVHQPGHDNVSLQALLARSTPTPQHSLASAISAMASVANHSSATVGAMASAGLNVNTVKNPLTSSLASSSHTVTLNKSATATSSHMAGAGDGLQGINFTMASSVGGNPMMNSLNMKAVGPSPGQMMGNVPGNVPGMQAMGMQQQHHNQMMNGPGFAPNMGQVRGMVPTTMSSAPPLPMGQNNMMGNSQIPQMQGHQNIGHIMNVPPNQAQLGKVSN